MRLRSTYFVLVLALCSSVSLAQTPPPAGTAPASPEPAPSTSAPAAPATPAQPPTPVVPAPQAERSTLFPNPSDPTGVEEGVLAAKPAVVLSGTSTWDEAFDSLKNAAAKLNDALKTAGIAPAGRPLAIFVETDDNGFKYE